MIQSNKIPFKKLYRLKSYLPTNMKTTSMYSVIFMNNPDLDTNIKLMDNHPLFVSNSKFFNYYIDPIYKEKIGNRKVNINFKNERKEIYEKVKENSKSRRTPINMDQLSNKNVYYDLYKYNEIFFKNIGSYTRLKKITMYFEFLAKLINKPEFNKYTVKTIFMDAGAWTHSNDYNDIDNPISYFYIAYKRYIDLFSILGDIDIIIYNEKSCVHFNPSLVNKNDFTLFKKHLSQVSSSSIYDNDDTIDNVNNEIDIEDEEMEKNKSDKFNFPGSSTKDDSIEDEDENIDDDLDEDNDIEISKVDFAKEIVPEDEIEDGEVNQTALSNINKDTSTDVDVFEEPDSEYNEIMRTTQAITNLRTPMSEASRKRNEELKKNQKTIKFEDKTIDEIVNINIDDIKISEVDISNYVQTTNENVTNIRFTNFEKSYNENLMKTDFVKIFTNLNDKSIPMYIRKMTVKDSSDELNCKDTYHIELEDVNRVRHSLTFDVPKFIDDKFLYINGSKKNIVKQLFMKPIVKTGPDEVQICTNYNKIFIYRYGKKISQSIDEFNKIISEPIDGVKIKLGNASKFNIDYNTILEYDELSKSVTMIKTKTCTFNFNQEEINEILKNKSITLKSNQMCIGFYKDDTPILLDIDSELVENQTIVDFIISNIGGKTQEDYEKTSRKSTKYIYSRAKIMEKYVPLVFLLGYCEGLTTVLRKGKIEYRFSDKNERVSKDETVIKFADGYFIYKNTPFKNSLLLNALTVIPTKMYNFDDFDEQSVYIEIFTQLYGSNNLANAFNTFYEFMIDPITKEILNNLNLPEDFVSILLEANSMLANNSYMLENNMNLYRIRSNEIINGIIYKEISIAYAKYRDTAHTKNAIKMSIKKDQIIKRILTVNTVEEMSVLNPIYEMDKTHAITPRGYVGMNSSHAYTKDKRSYDATMMGIIGISTSPKSVGAPV